jgi:putative peptidoglycan lipid II flippase
LLARRFGLGPELDVIIAALSAADVLTYFLMGAATSASIVPTLSKIPVDGDNSMRFKQASMALLDAALVLFFVLAIVGAALAPTAISLLAPGLAHTTAEYAADLSRAAMLGVVFTGLTLVQAPILQSRNRFGLTSASTAIFNSIIVIGLLVAWRSASPALVVALVVAATAVRWLVHDVALRKLGLAWRPFAGVNSSDAVRTILLALPSAIAVSLGDLGILIDRHFASHLGLGAVSTITLADKLTALPLGVLAGSFAAAAMPALAAAHDAPAVFRSILGDALWRTVGGAIAAMVAFLVLGRWIVAVAYGGGAFGPEEQALTAQVLMILAFGMPLAAVATILSRAAFALSANGLALFAAAAGLLARTGWQGVVTSRTEATVSDIAAGAVFGLGVQAAILGLWSMKHVGKRRDSAKA